MFSEMHSPEMHSPKMHSRANIFPVPVRAGGKRKKNGNKKSYTGSGSGI